MKTSVKKLRSKSAPALGVIMAAASAVVLGCAASASASTMTTLVTFTGATGVYPAGKLVVGPDHLLYGTTIAAGPANFGTVYKTDTAGHVTVVASLDFTNGAYPESEVTFGSDGTIYGTAGQGGIRTPNTSGGGTIYQVSPAGKLSFIKQFDTAAEHFPIAGLTQLSPDVFIGTTEFYGVNTGQNIGFGALVKVSNGQVTMVHQFTSKAPDTAYPFSSLTKASDGNLYGVTAGGTGSDFGGVYKMTPAGQYSIVHSFTKADKIAEAQASLTEGPDGALYGVSRQGGTKYGAVYKVAKSGATTIVHSFQGKVDGASPQGDALVLYTDGKMYGTTTYGGAHGVGTIYRISTAGQIESLYSFTGGKDGNSPRTGLTIGPDGLLYGTTIFGGIGDGVLYAFNPN